MYGVIGVGTASGMVMLPEMASQEFFNKICQKRSFAPEEIHLQQLAIIRVATSQEQSEARSASISAGT
jgi:hypothetical protein